MALDETVILHFDIDETPAVNSIRDLRAANTELRKSRDGVNIATKEGQELVQKLNVAIDKNNATIKANSSALEKQRQNVGNYTNSIKDAAKELNVFGVNVGALGDKIQAFVNPATAAVGVLTALGAAYANSTAGAKDLEFAQNQLSAAINLVSNDFGNFISSSEDGEGVITILANSILFKLNPSLALTSRNIALLQEQFEDLTRNERLARGEINALLEDNAEKVTQIQDSQTEYAEKVHLVGEILTNINAAEESIKGVLNEQLKIAEQKLAADQANEKLIDERNIVLQQISAEDRKFGKQRQAILRLESNIKDQYNAQAAAQKAAKDIQDEAERNAKRNPLEAGGSGITGGETSEIDTAKTIGKIAVDFEKNKQNQLTEAKEEGEAIRRAMDEAALEQALYYSEAITALASIGGEQTALFKAAAIIQTTIATYSSATKAFDSLAGIPYVGPALGAAAAAAAIANGLANVAQISGIAAAGGADFVTSKPTMLIVGDNPGGRERVTVEPLSGKGKTRTFGGGRGVAMAGGGSLTFDPRANDGGFVANTNMEATRQTMMLSNMLRNMPAPVVSVVEINRVSKRVAVKENLSRV